MKPLIPALTGAMLAALAMPAFAGHSTPKEREETRQLNLDAARQAQSTTQQISATAPTAQNQAPPAAAPTMPVETAPDQNQNASPADNTSPDAGPSAQ
jgi:hypothetical protein